ncbi:uncharacterized protein CEXT_578511 [Caerostris extrusa]|uniref:Uncharacterized protein n=1 Tax=Caerostris extrusa TaxID=172846 RepID=A0AAV4MR22_CAEEX|nr:uncharacterized protein CEXT_578511 [Caerostris extrusa]
MIMEASRKPFFPPEFIVPMKETNHEWIYATSVTYENWDDIDPSTIGKWLLFYDNVNICEARGMTQHDYAWSCIKKLAEDNVLFSAKCSTACNNEPGKSMGVICCYTQNYSDKKDVKRAADAIRQAVHFPRDMFYKTDNDTRAGKYRYNGSKFISIYKHTIENKMYERDGVLKYKWHEITF